MTNQISDLVSAAGLAYPSSTLSSVQPVRDTPDAIKKAAIQFESLLIGQIMKSARGDESGWLGNDEDEAGSSLTEMSEQQLSQTLAVNGGLGLAKMIAAGLAKTTSANPSEQRL